MFLKEIFLTLPAPKNDEVITFFRGERMAILKKISFFNKNNFARTKASVLPKKLRTN